MSWINNRENYGQALDILPGFEKLKEEDIMKIYELKTGTYTFQGPVYVGAVLAGADEEKIAVLQKYAYNLGVAFQLQDDLNEIFGESQKIGKLNDTDIKDGKKTLLIAKALELCSLGDKEFLIKEYGNSKVSEISINKIKNIIEKCGALDYCRNKFNELIEEAKKSIEDIELREKGKNYLIEMADYIGSL